MRPVALIPALDAARSVGAVLRRLLEAWPFERDPAAIVIDDGSTDDTARVAAEAGAMVLRHAENLGKGAALKTGLQNARALGFDVAVTLDADGQHPPDEAVRIAADVAPRETLVLGSRDLVTAGAKAANRFGNGVSNFFLSGFARRRFGDTQCGLRRYPVGETLALGIVDDGYAFEAEVVLRAARAGWTIVEVPVRVVYPSASGTRSHFRVVRDPARIVYRVVRTLVNVR